MKKVFVALTLMMFVGSVSASVYSTANGNSTEISKRDDKKDKKKKKVKGEKKACCKKTEGEKKACCSSEKK
jgi:hypothetical protein